MRRNSNSIKSEGGNIHDFVNVNFNNSTFSTKFKTPAINVSLINYKSIKINKSNME